MSDEAIITGVIVVVVVSVVAIYLGAKDLRDLLQSAEATCNKNGGVLIIADSGTYCVSRDAFIVIDK